MASIEKAIIAANLGLNPSNDGKIIRIPIPELTEQRRKEFVKIVKNMAEDGRIAVAGPDGLCFRTPVEHRGENMRTIGEFTVRKGERFPFVLTWYASNERPPRPIDAEDALADTLEYWSAWADR